MTPRRPTTADEFTEQYAARSGVTVEFLRESGREARPCECGKAMCDGWQMAHIEENVQRQSVPAKANDEAAIRASERAAVLAEVEALREALRTIAEVNTYESCLGLPFCQRGQHDAKCAVRVASDALAALRTPEVAK